MTDLVPDPDYKDKYLRALAELENLRAACERAAERGDVRVAEPTAFAAGTIYADSGPHQVGADLLDRVLRLPGLARRRASGSAGRRLLKPSA